jgi:hypothetical protein
MYSSTQLRRAKSDRKCPQNFGTEPFSLFLRFCPKIDFTVFARLLNLDIDSFSYYMGEWWTRAGSEGPLVWSVDLPRAGWLAHGHYSGPVVVEVESGIVQ